LIEQPKAGSVIPGSGGVRKLRWRAAGRGKRGGYRVVYFTKKEQSLIWMLTQGSRIKSSLFFRGGVDKSKG